MIYGRILKQQAYGEAH